MSSLALHSGLLASLGLGKGDILASVIDAMTAPGAVFDASAIGPPRPASASSTSTPEQFILPPERQQLPERQPQLTVKRAPTPGAPPPAASGKTPHRQPPPTPPPPSRWSACATSARK